MKAVKHLLDLPLDGGTGSVLTRTGCCSDLTASAAEMDPTLDLY